MNGLRLLQDGTIEYVIAIDRKTYSYKEIEQKQSHKVLSMLANSIELGDGYTLYSFFCMLVKYPLLGALHEWGSEYINEFKIQKFKMVETPLDAENKIELSNAVYLKTKKLTNPDDILEIHSAVDGIIEYDLSGAKYEPEYKIDISKCCDGSIREQSLCMVPLVDALSSKIVLNRKFRFDVYDTKLPKALTEEYDDSSDFSLLDFVTLIIDEISFHGNEKDKAKVREDLAKLVENFSLDDTDFDED